jgi:gamma-glutamylcyclotransferase (GGCT)/AIG2-like uncharacterized protein YtfP
MASKLYLAYGANTAHNDMAYRCPGAEWVGNCELFDFALVFRGVADVVPRKGATMECAVWRINDDNEAALDRFEGVAHGLYWKDYVELEWGDTTERALIYRMARHRRDRCPPPPSYRATLERGYKECGMPLQQIVDAVKESHRDDRPRIEYRGKWAKPTPSENPYDDLFRQWRGRQQGEY